MRRFIGTGFRSPSRSPVQGRQRLGTAFYVMDYCRGPRVLGPACPTRTGRARARLDAKRDSRGCTPSTQRLGLATSGAPATTGAPGRALVAAVPASETETMPAMDQLIAWLPEHLPPTGARLVHGDYRLDNPIIHPSSRSVSPCSTGSCRRSATRRRFRLPPDGAPAEPNREAAAAPARSSGSILPVLGIPTLEDYVGSLMPRRMGLFPRSRISRRCSPTTSSRLAAILQGIVGRVRDGTAPRTRTPPRWPRRCARSRRRRGTGPRRRDRGSPARYTASRKRSAARGRRRRAATRRARPW